MQEGHEVPESVVKQQEAAVTVEQVSPQPIPEQPKAVEDQSLVLYEEVLQGIPRIDAYQQSASNSLVSGRQDARFQLPDEKNWFQVYGTRTGGGGVDRAIIIEEGTPYLINEVDLPETARIHEGDFIYAKKLEIHIREGLMGPRNGVKTVFYDREKSGPGIPKPREDPQEARDFLNRVLKSATPVPAPKPNPSPAVSLSV